MIRMSKGEAKEIVRDYLVSSLENIFYAIGEGNMDSEFLGITEDTPREEIYRRREDLQNVAQIEVNRVRSFLGYERV